MKIGEVITLKTAGGDEHELEICGHILNGYKVLIEPPLGGERIECEIRDVNELIDGRLSFNFKVPDDLKEFWNKQLAEKAEREAEKEREQGTSEDRGNLDSAGRREQTDN